tara:strand:- start:73171 stop:73275 length:105 start_codon:yes stop_codon:yes gene_type:complete
MRRGIAWTQSIIIRIERFDRQNGELDLREEREPQ